MLIVEDRDKQKPIYFSSKVLMGAEMRYHLLEKLVYTLLVSTHKLPPYYQQYEIIVQTHCPMRQIIPEPDIAVRLVNWSMELSEFGLTFEPHHAIKGQALADFVIEMTLANPVSFVW